MRAEAGFADAVARRRAPGRRSALPRVWPFVATARLTRNLFRKRRATVFLWTYLYVFKTKKRKSPTFPTVVSKPTFLSIFGCRHVGVRNKENSAGRLARDAGGAAKAPARPPLGT